MRNRAGYSFFATLLIVTIAVIAPRAGWAAIADHVVVIGCDGLSPDGVRRALTPNLDRLMREGAYTLHARGVMPTMSGPNWASMITGVGPEQHGVLNNDWRPGVSKIAPTDEGSVKDMFPTIFGLLREQRPEAHIAVIHDWGGFAVLFEADVPDEAEHVAGSRAAAQRAAKLVEQERPTLTFVHLDWVDAVGHDAGHGTDEYYRAVEEIDEYVGIVLDAIDAAGIADRCIVIVTSDHGGVGKRHGRPTMAEIEIPWIVRGPGVIAGKELSAGVNTYDTAATIGYVLDLTPHPHWIGRPVLEAFKPE